MSGNVVQEGPFRTQTFEDVRTVITAQMVGTCRVLKDWEKFKPVVAGGALWSWAAKEIARDVDIFVKKSWRTKRRADQIYGVDRERNLLGKTKQSVSYGGTITVDGHVPVLVYKSVLPGDTGTPMDFVLTPWRGAEVTCHFDYLHDTVAFGRGIACTNGATYYKAGMYIAVYDKHRDKELVKKKVKQTLWNNPDAKEKLNQVMVTLSHIYAQIDV